MRRIRIIGVLTGIVAVVVAGLSLNVGGAGGLGPTECNLTNVRSVKNVDVDGGSLNNGAPVIQWTPHLGTNQIFKYDFAGTTPAGQAVVRIRNLNSNKVLDVRAGSVENGAQVIQWEQHAGTNQLWVRVTTAQAGVVLFANVNSGKMLDVQGGSSANGAPLIQWTFHGDTNQVFKETGGCTSVFPPATTTTTLPPTTTTLPPTTTTTEVPATTTTEATTTTTEAPPTTVIQG